MFTINKMVPGFLLVEGGSPPLTEVKFLTLSQVLEELAKTKTGMVQ